MTKSTKAGWIGAGLLVTGAGLTMIGAALITPVCLMWSSKQAKKLADVGTERFLHNVETASTTLGTMIGRLEGQFRQAARLASDVAKATRRDDSSLPISDGRASA